MRTNTFLLPPPLKDDDDDDDDDGLLRKKVSCATALSSSSSSSLGGDIFFSFFSNGNSYLNVKLFIRLPHAFYKSATNMGAAESTPSSSSVAAATTRRVRREPKHKCVLLFDEEDDEDGDAMKTTTEKEKEKNTLLLSRKMILRLVWNLPKRLRISWRLAFDSRRDGLSYNQLINCLMKNEVTSFCIAVETRERKGEIFGALISFAKGEGLKANKTDWMDYKATSESYLFTFPREQAPKKAKRQPTKYLASANSDGHYVWCCRDLVSERFPNGLGFGGKEFPKHFAMHIDEHLEHLTTRKTGMTYEGWGYENDEQDSNVKIENETMTIERVEVWQCDADDERGEKPKKKNNIVAELDGSAAIAQRMMGGKKESKSSDGSGVLSEKHREARFLASVGSTKIALD